MKGLLWKGTVKHNRYSGTSSKNLWGVPLSYPEVLELSVKLHITKFTGRHVSRVSLVHVFSYEFCKTFKNTHFEEYQWTTASGCRLEHHVEIEPQRFKVGLSPSIKILVYLFHLKPFKNDDKCFLFHLKNSFCSQDI